MKRFYRAATAETVADGFAVMLDGRPLRTPAKNALVLPGGALAEAIAAEWQAQQDEIRPVAMPFTRLASTAYDRVAPNRAGVVDATAAYAASDLLCHRADAPAALAALQTQHWQPILDWASLRFDAPLRIAASILPIDQPASSLQALHGAVAALDLLALTGVADLTASLGSLLLALALHEGRIDAAEACAAAHLDEIFQNERWGEDQEAMVRRRAIEADIHAAARFLLLSRDAD